MEKLSNLNRTFTENGDLSYKSTLNANLDFFGQASSKRNNPTLAVELFEKAYKENKEFAIMNLLFLRDIKNGNGERYLTRVCLKWLADNDPDMFIRLMYNNFVEYGRWDDMIIFANHSNTDIQDAILKLIHVQLVYDVKHAIDNNPISLLAKWMPTESSKDIKKKNLARFIANNIFYGDYKLYRQIIGDLRSRLNLVETYLTNKDYSFDYNAVPAGASLKYMEAFLRNDEERVKEYLESIKKNPSKMTKKVDKMYPYQLSSMARKAINMEDRDQIDYINTLWEAYSKDDLKQSCIVVCDMSFSMTDGLGPKTSCRMIDVSSSLAIYVAERLPGVLKNHFITFSRDPELVDLSNCNSFVEKLLEVDKYCKPENTDIEKVYNLLYDVAEKTDGEGIPDYVLVLSDMEFDWGCDNEKSTLDVLKEKFANAGFKMPRMIWWNLNGRSAKFPTIKEDDNIYISGFSQHLFQHICNSESSMFNAEIFMMDTLRDLYDEFIQTLHSDNTLYLSSFM